MLNDRFKSFKQIEENELQLFQGQFVPYPVNSGHNIFKHMKDPTLDFALTFQTLKRRTDSGLANHISEERGQALDYQIHRSPCDHCDIWNCPSAQNNFSGEIYRNLPSCFKNIG
jgi:hypothetical protein